MSDKEWWHRLHGNDLHDLMIFLCERLVIKKGGKLKSVKDFKKRYICPCEPDIYFEIETKLVNGNKRTIQKGLYVVEVESSATRESIQRKWTQYKETLAGLTELIILNVSDIIATNNWHSLEEYIEARLPT